MIVETVKDKISVYPATKLEVIDILLSSGIVDKVSEEELVKDYYILQYDSKYKILFTYEELHSIHNIETKHIIEFHIAVPKDSFIAKRVLIYSLIDWLFTETKCDGLFTHCYEGTMSNLARKVGFIKIYEEGKINCFLLTKEQLI